MGPVAASFGSHPAFEVVGTSRVLSAILALALGCGPQLVTEASSAWVTVALRVDAHSNPVSVELVGEQGLVEAEDGDRLFLFGFEQHELLGSDGRFVDRKRLTSRLRTDGFPPGSCRRCPSLGAGPSMVLGAGFACSIPAWARARGLEVDGGSLRPANAPELLGRLAAAARIEVSGECEVPLESTGDPRRFATCAVTPPGAPPILGPLTISPRGEVAGIAGRSLTLLEGDGEERSIELDDRAYHSVAAGPPGRYLALANEDPVGRSWVVDVESATQDQVTTQPDLYVTNAGVSGDDIILAGSVESGPAAMRCQGRPMACAPALGSFPRDSCPWLFSNGSAEWFGQADGVEIFGSDAGMGFILMQDGDRRCVPEPIGGRPPKDLGPVAANGRTLVACAQYDTGLELLSTTVEGLTVGPWLTVRRLTSACLAVVPSGEGFRVVSRDELIELDASGTVRVVRALDEAWPALVRPVRRVASSTNGWTLVEDSARQLFVAHAGGTLTARRTRDAHPGPVSAIASHRQGCAAVSGGTVWRIEGSGGCDGLRVERTRVPALSELGPRLATALGDGGLAVVTSSPSPALFVVDPLRGDSRQLTTFETTPVAILELAPDRVLIAHPSALEELSITTGELRPVTLVSDDPETDEVEGPSSFSVETASFAGGVAWVGGPSTLARVFAAPDGLRAETYWRRLLDGLSSAAAPTRSVRGLSVGAPDQGWIFVTESWTTATVHRDALRVAQITQADDHLVLIEDRERFADLFNRNASAARKVVFGAGPRLTVGFRSSIQRTGGQTTTFPDVVAEATDCGEFQLVGLAADTTVAVVDE